MKKVIFTIIAFTLFQNIFCKNNSEIPEDVSITVDVETIDINSNDNTVVEEVIIEQEVKLNSNNPEIIENIAENIVEKEPNFIQIGGLDVEQSEYAQSMIRKYMGMYTSERGKQNLNYVLDKGNDYRIFIRKKIAEAGLPKAIEYLPVVESEFRVDATSKSGAKGLWQFMENSMKPFLKKNDWIDERLDPYKSTDAALKKLKENYDMFGDWALALAAYNCGAGLMLKTTKANPEKSFWELAEKGLLKNQTIHYVPKLLAITELAENQENYEIELPKISDEAEESQYDFVTTKKPIALTKIANEMNINVKTLKNLNPQLIRNVTPPSFSTGFQLRIPLGTEEIAKKAIEKLQKEIGNTTTFYVEHKITQGDTLWALSRTYGCKVDDICDFNGITQKTILKLGKILFIPLK